MNMVNNEIDDVNNICNSTPVTSDHSLLLQKILRLFPHWSFAHALTRGGWHRPGGVVAAEGERITNNVRGWIEKEFGNDLQQLTDRYADAGYIATSLSGKTHYFVAQTGDAAQDFVQLEVEELQEVTDHVMFSSESAPDSIEDLIDPLNVEKLPADLLGAPVYLFRRITPVAEFISGYSTERNKQLANLQRFMHDWDCSSARENGAFCRHWVLSLREHMDAWGEPVAQIKPVNICVNNTASIKIENEQRGIQLARLVNDFDHDIGYPMAWYFFMLTSSKVPYQLAEAIHKDLMGAYDYLPAKDVKVLKDWIAKPYGI